MDESSRAFLQDLLTDPGFQAGSVLDVRPAPEYAAGHLCGSVNLPVSLPAGRSLDPAVLAELLPSIFLPPRHQPLLVLAGRPEEAEACASALAARGRPTVTARTYPRTWPGDFPDPWVTRGVGRQHLWRPDRWLVLHEGMLPPPAAGPVLDLGCGSGRAAVWLALRGYRVTGIDRQPEALELGRTLAAHCGVDCDLRPGDLRDQAAVPPGPWAVILNFRYLQRDLLGQFARWLRPGGVAVVRTFRQAPGYVGHPHPRHRLGVANCWAALAAGD